MRFPSGLVLALGLLLPLALPAAARPLSEDEAASLASALTGYGRATEAKNAEKLVATIPPRVVNVVAGTAGIEAAKIQETLVEQTKAVLKTSTISNFVTAPGPFEANDAALADGTAVVWVVVPAQFDAKSDGKSSRNNQPLLAIREGESWFFSRIDGPQQQQIVALAYPFMAEAKLPAATQVPLD